MESYLLSAGRVRTDLRLRHAGKIIGLTCAGLAFVRRSRLVLTGFHPSVVKLGYHAIVIKRKPLNSSRLHLQNKFIPYQGQTLWLKYPSLQVRNQHGKPVQPATSSLHQQRQSIMLRWAYHQHHTRNIWGGNRPSLRGSHSSCTAPVHGPAGMATPSQHFSTVTGIDPEVCIMAQWQISGSDSLGCGHLDL